MKIGYGFDVHRLEADIPFILGGIRINHNKGCVGHSDADVLIHAICDALLGAVNSRDIGYQFPDTDEQYKGIDSKILLKKTIDIVKSKSFEIGNIDCTICLQEPKISPYIEKMQKVLCKVMRIEVENLSIKATTTEKLGFVGSEEGVSAHAVVLLMKNDAPTQS